MKFAGLPFFRPFFKKNRFLYFQNKFKSNFGFKLLEFILNELLRKFSVTN